MSNNDLKSPKVLFTIIREKGRVKEVSTNSSQINHFLDLIKMSRAYNTWISYTEDLKLFFETILKSPEVITRADCLEFMKQQDRDGCSGATINRRLAAVSSLFNELCLLEPDKFSLNPVYPHQVHRESKRTTQGLYRKQAQPVPEIVPENDLRAFFNTLTCWRDRTLVLLMWISCLRISEAVNIHFQDIECSRRSIHIPVTKGNNPRTVYMDVLTFSALNQYLDKERKDLFPKVPQIFLSFKGVARGTPLSVNAVQKMIRYNAEKCALSDLHAHLFRHTGITQLVQQGMSEPAIRDMVGHRNPNSLSRYLHLCDQFVEAEFDRAQEVFTSLSWLETNLAGGVK
jgi:site-specific recombinase XerD